MLEDEDITAGDFVRVVRQVIDLLRQIADVASVPATVDRGASGRRRAAPRRRRRVEQRPDRRRSTDERSRRSMPISKGEPWGAPGTLPDGRASSSRPTPRPAPRWRRPGASGRPFPPLGLTGGDLCRTLGGRGALRDGRALRPRRGARRRPGAATSSPTSSCGGGRCGGGARWRCCNAQYVGAWDVAPRSHPGDGKLDVVEVDAGHVGSATGGRRGGGCRRAPTCPTRRSRCARCRPCSSTSPAAGSRSTASRCRPARTLSVRVEPDALTVVVLDGGVVNDRIRAGDGSSTPSRTGSSDEVERRADAAGGGEPRDLGAPRAQLRGALRPRPADRAARRRRRRGRAQRVRRRHRVRRPGRHRGPDDRRAVRVRRPARHRPRLRPQHHRHRRPRRRAGGGAPWPTSSAAGSSCSARRPRRAAAARCSSPSGAPSTASTRR